MNDDTKLLPERRDRILDAATDLFGRYGFRRTSMDLIATDAAVAKATLYAYFDSKEALFRAVTQHVCSRFLRGAEEAAERDAPVRERLRGVLESKYTQLYELVHSSAHAEEILDSSDRLGRTIVEDADRKYRNLLEKLLKKAEQSGEIDLHGASAGRVADVLGWCALGISHSVSDVGAHKKRLAEALDAIIRFN